MSDPRYITNVPYDEGYNYEDNEDYDDENSSASYDSYGNRREGGRRGGGRGARGRDHNDSKSNRQRRKGDRNRRQSMPDETVDNEYNNGHVDESEDDDRYARYGDRDRDRSTSEQRDYRHRRRRRRDKAGHPDADPRSDLRYGQPHPNDKRFPQYNQGMAGRGGGGRIYPMGAQGHDYLGRGAAAGYGMGGYPPDGSFYGQPRYDAPFMAAQHRDASGMYPMNPYGPSISPIYNNHMPPMVPPSYGYPNVPFPGGVPYGLGAGRGPYDMGPALGNIHDPLRNPSMMPPIQQPASVYVPAGNALSALQQSPLPLQPDIATDPASADLQNLMKIAAQIEQENQSLAPLIQKSPLLKCQELLLRMLLSDRKLLSQACMECPIIRPMRRQASLECGLENSTNWKWSKRSN